ncbi:MAG: rhomboid family intramembrane serine protease [Planctomycetota bacterium]|nr:rhomboid family intramembrane serine protease [Planctomycetota bacterium]
MRQIGKLQEEASTKKLVAYLLTRQIKAIAEKGDDCWDIWIKEEDDVDRSRALLEEFQKDPSHPRYAEAVEQANRLAREELDRQEKNRQNVIVMRSNWSRGGSNKKPLVITMMILCVMVFMMTRGWDYNSLGGGSNSSERTVVLKSLLFVNPDDARAAVIRQMNEGLAEFDQARVQQSDRETALASRDARKLQLQRQAEDDIGIKFTNIRSGQFWRLFTPMFIHFGLLHILFNMMWLHSLGGQFENRLGTVRFGVFVLTAAVVSCVVQQIMPVNMQGTSALTIMGGMSGVNYALGGFIWMKSIHDPRSGFFLSPVSMFILVVWMMMGILDGGNNLSMANWAHGSGFIFGLVCGYLPILRVSQAK